MTPSEELRDAVGKPKCARPTCLRVSDKNSHLCRPHFRQERAAGRCGLVDAAPVQAHILTLMAAGWGWSDIENVSGVSRSQIKAAAEGRKEKVRVSTVHRILAVAVTAPLPPTPRVTRDSFGFVRRTQALACLGWRQADLAELLGCHPRDVANASFKGRVSRALHAAMVELYDRLQATTGPSSYTAIRARGKGWVPPCGWDNIDDQAEIPNHVDSEVVVVDEVAVRRVVNGGDVSTLNRAEKAAAARALAARGNSASAVAAHLRMSHRTVRKVVAA